MKKSRDVKRVTFSKAKTNANELVHLAGGDFGNAYIGRVHFNDGSIHRVAIKIFHHPGLTDEKAARYQRAIQDLRQARVKLPKMGMHKLTEGPHKGEWVQISQLFGSTKKGSKIQNHNGLSTNTSKASEELILELTKIANAGYNPAYDAIEPFKDETKGRILIDIDQIRKSLASERAENLINLINHLTRNQHKRKKLLNLVMQTASPEMKEAITSSTLSRRITRE